MRQLVPFALAAVLGLGATACSHGGASSSLPAVGNSGGSAGTTSAGRSPRSAPAGWATTATQAIAPANATDLGVLDATKTITIDVGLPLRNLDGAKAAVAAGQIMTRDEFVNAYGPSPDTIAAVTNYLQSQGFSNVTASPNGILISATAPSATVAKAFNTELHAFSANGAIVYANTQPAYVPSALAGKVAAVLGLTNAQGIAPHPLLQPSTGVTPGTFGAGGAATATSCVKNVNGTTGAPVCPRFYDPATYSIAYDVGKTAPATNTALAIFAEGDPSIAISDFRYNETQFGLPQVPVNVIHAGAATTDTSGNGEWTLDLTYTQGLAYNLREIDLYTASSMSFHDLTVSFNKWVVDNRAPVMNASVGGCEVFPYQSGDMLVGDEILVEAAAQGQTLFASTGDTGAYCGVAGVPPNGGVGGVPMVEYPASSPYAVAVGGTDLFSNVDGTYLGEQSWQSGGGGLSQFEYSPYWESPVQPVGTTPAGLTFRGLPDVAFDAALETGALLYEGGTQYITGGTSLASPISAGIYARMQSAHGNRLGFAPLRYYHIFGSSAATQLAGPPETELVGPFHDILTGTNGAYTALPKYDYTTGMGSVDVSRLASAIAQ